MKKWMFHLGFGIFWLFMIVPTVTIWKDSILLVLLMSLYANIESSFAAYEAARESKRKRSNNVYWKASSYVFGRKVRQRSAKPFIPVRIR